MVKVKVDGSIQLEFSCLEVELPPDVDLEDEDTVVDAVMDAITALFADTIGTQTGYLVVGNHICGYAPQVDSWEHMETPWEN